MSTAQACLVLAAELAVGFALIIRHELAHHGLAARLHAAAHQHPVPEPTPHEAWERGRLSAAQRRVSLAAAMLADGLTSWAWVAGHHLPLLATLGLGLAALAIGQPLAVRASRRAVMR